MGTGQHGRDGEARRGPAAASGRRIRGARARRAAPRGIALLMVLWLLAFLSIVLAAFAFSVRTELFAAKSFVDEAEAAALAKAGFSRAIAALSAAQASPGPPPSAWEGTLGRGTYRAVLTDEASKLPLNRASEDALRRLLRNTGVRDPELLGTLVDSILDWIDTDDLHRLHGAETAYYQGLPQPYRARNGEVESLDELLLVRGMTREILDGNVSDPERLASLLEKLPEERDLQPGEYLGVRPFLSLQPVQPTAAKAGLEVLLALGTSPAEALATLQRRKDGAGGTSPLPAAPAGGPIASAGTFTIASVGRIGASGFTYRITATVQRDVVQGRARTRVLSWQEGV